MGIPEIPGIGKAVHSSILVDDIEYEFNGQGIVRCQGPQSHQRFPGRTEMIDMGTSMRGGTAMRDALSQYFPAGTYDLLRKNCNTFSDCALFYLTGQRMSRKYRCLEQVGETLDSWTPIIGALFKNYKKNPNADRWDTHEVVQKIDGHRQAADVGIQPVPLLQQAQQHHQRGGYPGGYPQQQATPAPAVAVGRAGANKGLYRAGAAIKAQGVRAP